MLYLSHFLHLTDLGYFNEGVMKTTNAYLSQV